MEGADQVLALGCVDRGLAAHRGIHLGQEGGGDLHEADAALVDGRREAREVAHHAAPEGHDQVAAIKLEVEQAAGQLGQMGEALGLLAGRQGDQLGLDARLLQAVQQRPAVGGGDGLVGDHRSARTFQQRPQQLSRLGQQARTDQYRIGPLGEPDLDPQHQPTAGSNRPARAARMASTAALAGRSSVTTVMSASA